MYENELLTKTRQTDVAFHVVTNEASCADSLDFAAVLQETSHLSSCLFKLALITHLTRASSRRRKKSVSFGMRNTRSCVKQSHMEY